MQTFFETRMWHCFLIIVLVFTTVRVQSDEVLRNMDCSNNSAVQGDPGQQLTLMSTVKRLKRCYFVSTDKSTGTQCCYNLRGYDMDCEDSTYYKVQDKTYCLKENITYEMKLESRDSKTCNITIMKLSGAAAGQWMSYNPIPNEEDKPLDEQGCVVMVTQQLELSSVNLVTAIVSSVIGALLLVVVLFLLNRKFKFFNRDNNSGEQPEQEKLSDTRT